ncbi:MAG: ScpA family protein [Alphaproteobacteria bacterium]|jgi:segregation and condensation protein A|nr:ScpA family protein [Alphaproteobacteria bacterium]
MNTAVDNFEQPVPDYMQTDAAPSGAELIVHLDGFEGPIDLLLNLARDQKVDLAKISILGLAEQYLSFIEEARQLRLEIAADYLVMAAWLAYLKSRLLLPSTEDDEEPSGAELAAALSYQLQRLESMRTAAENLFARPLLGRDVFARGAPEGIRVTTRSVYDATLFELLQAYGSTQRRQKPAPLRIEQMDLFSMDDALGRLTSLLGKVPNWSALLSFLPDGLEDDLIRRSAVAATFAASLELVRSGQAEIRQDQLFGPIFFRSRSGNRTAVATDLPKPDIRLSIREVRSDDDS